MNMQRSISLSLAGAIALALFGATGIAMAQQTASPASSPQFYPGTKSSGTYKLADGATLTVNAGMPDHVQSYGPPPPFKTLDTNHNGRISEAEAKAYPPLDSDFLFASGGGKFITKAQYEHWVKTQE